MGKIIFITGTDTGVGKTLVTALLLEHLRQGGVRALAMKPFCSGGRGDVAVLQAMQLGELLDDEVNPFYFKDPVAPLVSARKLKKRIPWREVIRRIRAVASKCDCLLVEGAGGLLVPLGENYTALDLIRTLCCDVLVVARNQLGTINHTLLTVRPLCKEMKVSVKIVLSDVNSPDLSVQTNKKILSELLAPIPVISLCSLGQNAVGASVLKINAKKHKKVLAQIAGVANLFLVL